jgi:hypothetical protein
MIYSPVLQDHPNAARRLRKDVHDAGVEKRQTLLAIAFSTVEYDDWYRAGAGGVVVACANPEALLERDAARRCEVVQRLRKVVLRKFGCRTPGLCGHRVSASLLESPEVYALSARIAERIQGVCRWRDEREREEDCCLHDTGDDGSSSHAPAFYLERDPQLRCGTEARFAMPHVQLVTALMDEQLLLDSGLKLKLTAGYVEPDNDEWSKDALAH